MRKLKKIVLRQAVLGIILFGALQSAFAQTKPNTLVIESQNLSFVPSEAFFLILYDDSTFVRAKAFQFKVRENSSNLDSADWLFGAIIGGRLSTETSHYALVVKSASGQVQRGELRPVTAQTLEINQAQQDSLRELVIQKQSMIASLRLQIQTQEEELQRLQNETAKIAGFAQVITLRDKLDYLRAQSTNAEANGIMLSHLLKLSQARASIPPKNALYRESLLTAQIKDLADAAKRAESAELTRTASMDAILKGQQVIIDSVAGDSEKELFEELRDLRRQVQELESGR
jgi:hypothetical protein